MPAKKTGVNKTKKADPKDTKSSVWDKCDPNAEIIDQMRDIRDIVENIDKNDSSGRKTNTWVEEDLRALEEELTAAEAKIKRLEAANKKLKNGEKQIVQLKKKLKTLVEKLKEDMKTVQEFIKQYGELEENLGKAVENIFDNIKEADTISDDDGVNL